MPLPAGHRLMVDRTPRPLSPPPCGHSAGPGPILSPLFYSMSHAQPLPASVTPALPTGRGQTRRPPCAAWGSHYQTCPPSLLPPHRALFKRAPPLSPAIFFSLHPHYSPALTTLPVTTPPLSSILVVVPIPPEATDDRQSRPPPERRHLELTPPALPSTSPSSCMSWPHRIPCTSSPGWMPLAMPAHRRAHGHRAVTTGSACAPHRTRTDWDGCLLGHAAGHRATAHGLASSTRRMPWAGLRPGTVQPV
jgi:hypothetical protein